MFLPKLVYMTKNTSFFSNFARFCTPKQCTRVQCLVLKNNPNYVNFWTSLIPPLIFECPPIHAFQTPSNHQREMTVVIVTPQGWKMFSGYFFEKVNFSIAKYWNISSVAVLPENVIFTFFRTCWCYSDAYNTGTQKWSSIVQYSCTSIWDLKYTFSYLLFFSMVSLKKKKSWKFALLQSVGCCCCCFF